MKDSPSQLRNAVITCMIATGHVDAESLAIMAKVSTPRAKAFLTTLEERGVLAAGTYGEGWAEFVMERTTSKPRGVVSGRDDGRDWRAIGESIRQCRGQVSIRAVSKMAGITVKNWWSVERGVKSVRRETVLAMIKAACELNPEGLN